jgi:formylglycine-generating enzyme required for sulfatase activity
LNCDSEWSGRSAPVGSFESNAYGLYDMAGNVWERTCSIYRDKYEGSEGVCASSDVSGDRVLRGGSWKSHSRKLRSANRQPSLDPYVRSAYRGFRLAIDN